MTVLKAWVACVARSCMVFLYSSDFLNLLRYLQPFLLLAFAFVLLIFWFEQFSLILFCLTDAARVLFIVVSRKILSTVKTTQHGAGGTLRLIMFLHLIFLHRVTTSIAIKRNHLMLKVLPKTINELRVSKSQTPPNAKHEDREQAIHMRMLCSGTLRLGGYNVTGEKQENKMSAMQREALKTKIGIPPLPPRAGEQLG